MLYKEIYDSHANHDFSEAYTYMVRPILLEFIGSFEMYLYLLNVPSKEIKNSPFVASNISQKNN